MIRNPLDDAEAAGLRVDIVMLGDWGSARLLSEYDHAARTIRVDGASLAAIRDRGGAHAGVAFVAAAVAHELYHHDVAVGRIARSSRTEEEVHACERVLRRYGIDASIFEAALR